jgi:nucleoside-diphosphate-sugar epimerase
MRIIITGNMGYIGPVLVGRLRETMKSAFLIGVDTGYFAHSLVGGRILPEVQIDQQWFKDVRDLSKADFKKGDAVVYLAAISNDPMGSAFERPTHEINCAAAVRTAKLAKEAGARSFVFASSCSVYGFAENGVADENSPVGPQSAYARSKRDCEELLAPLAHETFTVTCLRFATACGMSPRLRLDLVLNDFVASALATGNIDIFSDGTPWRPLITVDDMARAIEWAIVRSAANGGALVVVNTGSDDWNYQVKDLAHAVVRLIPGTSVNINKGAAPDRRSYRVSFAKFASLAPGHVPKTTLASAVDGLIKGLRRIKFADASFRSSEMIRLRALARLREENSLDENLRWQ